MRVTIHILIKLKGFSVGIFQPNTRTAVLWDWNTLTHWSLRDVKFYELISLALPVKFVLGQCHKTFVMIIQHWFGWLLGADRHQTITWDNVGPNLCRHIYIYIYIYCHLATKGIQVRWVKKNSNMLSFSQKNFVASQFSANTTSQCSARVLRIPLAAP